MRSLLTGVVSGWIGAVAVIKLGKTTGNIRP